MTMFWQSYPNRVTKEITPGDTAVHFVASDGSIYATLAALQAAGKTAWPGLDPGCNQAGMLCVRSIAASGSADGSPFYYATNTPTAVQTSMTYVSGSGQERQVSGTLWCVAIKATSATDIIELEWRY